MSNYEVIMLNTVTNTMVKQSNNANFPESFLDCNVSFSSEVIILTCMIIDSFLLSLVWSPMYASLIKMVSFTSF